MRTLENHTRIHTGKCRVSDDRVIEQLVTTIQHKTTEERVLGVCDVWEPVFVDGEEVFLSENLKDILTIHLFPMRGVNSILYTGEYFIDDNGFISGNVTIVMKEAIVRSCAFLLLDNYPILVEVL